MSHDETAAGPSGLKKIQAAIKSGVNIAPIGLTMDFNLVSAEFGKTEFVAHPGKEHLNPAGVVHGGYAATVLDSAVGIAILTALPAARSFTTLELKVNYVRALPQDGSPVTATGEVIHVGRTTATAEGRMVDNQGRLLAHATTTCLILDNSARRGT